MVDAQSDDRPAGPQYRSDGWPLCPQCGEDELADLSVRDWPETFKADPAAELGCYNCRWVGCVPLRDHPPAPNAVRED